MKVTLFKRNSLGGFSIENITENLANHLSGQVEVKIFTPSYSNKGILNCLKSMLEVIRHQGDINHITGDSHFLSYFLNKKKTIITIHDCERLMTDNFGFFKKVIYQLFWFTIPNLRCAYITTVSKESRANLSRYAGIDKDRILVIYDGIDDRFVSLGLSQDEKNSLLQNKKHKKAILHVSSIKEIKNVKFLIASINLLTFLISLILETCKIAFLCFLFCKRLFFSS